MADADFPRRYDVIVLGTGLVESMVAAALARNGRQVLHLDRNDYYGGTAAVHSLEAVRRWAADRRSGFSRIKPAPSAASDDGSSSSNLVSISLADDSVTNVEEVICTDLRAAMPVGTTVIAGEMPAETSAAEGSRPTDVPAMSASAAEKPAICGEPEPLATADMSAAASVVQQDPDRAVCAAEAASGGAKGDSSWGAGVAVSAGAATHMPVNAATLAGGCVPPEPTHCWTLDKLLAHSRQFNLDLNPKVLYSNGDMVQLLISSNVTRYCEFQAVTRILSLATGSRKEADATDERGCAAPLQFEQVPCGRSDVFNSRSLSLVEKRILSKLLTDSSLQAFSLEEPLTLGGSPATVSTTPRSEEPPEGTYDDFLRKKGCSAHLVHLLLNSVAMVPKNGSAKEAMAKTRKFLASAGRYGATPFLWPMYGGELSQAFCRVCAVFGGTYVLGRTAQFLTVDENNSCDGIVCNEGVRLQSRYLVLDSTYIPHQMVAPGKVLRRTSRAILITDRSIQPATDSDEVSILALPASECGVEDPSAAPVILLELPNRTAACPKGLYVVHLTCTSRLETARKDFEVIVSKLFNFGSGLPGCSDGVSRPRTLWALYFNQQDFTDHAGCDHSAPSSHSIAGQYYCGRCCQLPDNIYICDGLGSEFDYDAAVLRAKALFDKLCPGEEFLPPPEDDGAPCAAEDDDTSYTGSATELASTDSTQDSVQPAQPILTDSAEAKAVDAAAVDQQPRSS